MPAAEILFRRNTVREVLRGRRRVDQLWLEKGDQELAELAEIAQERGVPVTRTPKAHLDGLAGERGHQGAVVAAGLFPYASVEEMLNLALDRGEPPLLLLLDLIHGPHNIGALLRTAEACGAHGVIMQDRRAPDITPQVVNYSAGAVEHLLVAQVTNLVTTIQRLKQEEVWIVGLDRDPQAQRPEVIDLSMPLGIVVGHEGRGLRRLVRRHCDLLLELPMRGRVTSLNAAIAGSIALYQAWAARGYPGTS